MFITFKSKTWEKKLDQKYKPKVKSYYQRKTNRPYVKGREKYESH